MSMTVWIIFAGVMAVVIVFGLITKAAEGAPVAWKRLHELHPAPTATPGPGAREMRVFLLEPRGDKGKVRGKQLTVRYTTDDDSLDAWPVSIRGGASLGVSIPWADAELSEPAQTPFGPHVGLTIEGIVVMVPATAIESELAIRADLRAAADPLTEEIV
jgi:hypothetical protein